MIDSLCVESPNEQIKGEGLRGTRPREQPGDKRPRAAIETVIVSSCEGQPQLRGNQALPDTGESLEATGLHETEEGA